MTNIDYRKGDFIICIDNTNMNSKLTVHGQYLVAKVTKKYVFIIDDVKSQGAYNHERFKKIEDLKDIFKTVLG